MACPGAFDAYDQTSYTPTRRTLNSRADSTEVDTGTYQEKPITSTTNPSPSCLSDLTIPILGSFIYLLSNLFSSCFKTPVEPVQEVAQITGQPRILHISSTSSTPKPSPTTYNGLQASYSPSLDTRTSYDGSARAQEDRYGDNFIGKPQRKEGGVETILRGLRRRETSVGEGSTQGITVEERLQILRISQSGNAYLQEDFLRREKEQAELRRVRKEEAAREASRIAREEAEKRATRRTPAEPFIRPLSNLHSSLIEKLVYGGPNVGGIVNASDGTPLTKHDFSSVLGNSTWLNDEIINGYLGWIVSEANKTLPKTGKTEQVVAFNSFFYAKLSKEGFRGVARWSKRKNIDGKNFLKAKTVLIPINNSAHWTLLVISPRNKTVEYFDSLGGAPRGFISNAMSYLEGELGSAFVKDDWKILETSSATQRNGFDCGVFLLTNAECCSFDINTMSYSGKDMANQRRRIAAVLLNRGFQGGLETCAT